MRILCVLLVEEWDRNFRGYIFIEMCTELGGYLKDVDFFFSLFFRIVSWVLGI